MWMSDSVEGTAVRVVTNDLLAVVILVVVDLHEIPLVRGDDDLGVGSDEGGSHASLAGGLTRLALASGPVVVSGLDLLGRRGADVHLSQVSVDRAAA